MRFSFQGHINRGDVLKFDREARFCEIARQRLLLHPGAYEKFIGQSLHTGMKPGWQLVHLGGVHGVQDVGLQIAMWYIDPVRALADFDNQVVRIVDEWAYNNLPRPKPVEPLVLTAAPPSPAKTNPAPPPARRVTATQAQDATILHAIRELGYDPMHLPVAPSGRPGVRKEVRDKLVGRSPEFPDGRRLGRVWQRMRDQGDIADAVD